MPRWTIRGVTPEAIRAIQNVQEEIGAPLGEIVSACIEAGLPEARRRLLQLYACTYPTADAINELQRLVLAFQLAATPVPRGLPNMK
jgi:hypothetical protein